jgi:hypothetical protein
LIHGTQFSSAIVRRSNVFPSTVNHRNGSVPIPLIASDTPKTLSSPDHVGTTSGDGACCELHAVNSIAAAVNTIITHVFFLVIVIVLQVIK